MCKKIRWYKLFYIFFLFIFLVYSWVSAYQGTYFFIDSSPAWIFVCKLDEDFGDALDKIADFSNDINRNAIGYSNNISYSININITQDEIRLGVVDERCGNVVSKTRYSCSISNFASLSQDRNLGSKLKILKTNPKYILFDKSFLTIKGTKGAFSFFIVSYNFSQIAFLLLLGQIAISLDRICKNVSRVETRRIIKYLLDISDLYILVSTFFLCLGLLSTNKSVTLLSIIFLTVSSVYKIVTYCMSLKKKNISVSLIVFMGLFTIFLLFLALMLASSYEGWDIPGFLINIYSSFIRLTFERLLAYIVQIFGPLAGYLLWELRNVERIQNNKGNEYNSVVEELRGGLDDFVFIMSLILLTYLSMNLVITSFLIIVATIISIVISKAIRYLLRIKTLLALESYHYPCDYS